MKKFIHIGLIFSAFMAFSCSFDNRQSSLVQRPKNDTISEADRIAKQTLDVVEIDTDSLSRGE